MRNPLKSKILFSNNEILNKNNLNIIKKNEENNIIDFDNINCPDELISLKLILKYIFKYFPKDFQNIINLKNNLLFRGVIFRLKKNGIKDQKIDLYLRSIKEINKLLFDYNLNDYSYLRIEDFIKPLENNNNNILINHFDESLNDVINLNIDQLEFMNPNQRQEILKNWINYQRGILDGISNDFINNYLNVYSNLEKKKN